MSSVNSSYADDRKHVVGLAMIFKHVGHDEDEVKINVKSDQKFRNLVHDVRVFVSNHFGSVHSSLFWWCIPKDTGLDVHLQCQVTLILLLLVLPTRHPLLLLPPVVTT